MPMNNIFDIGGIFKRTAKRDPTSEEILTLGKLQRENPSAFENPALGVSAIEKFGLERTQQPKSQPGAAAFGKFSIPSTVYDEGTPQTPQLGALQTPQYITSLSEEERKPFEEARKSQEDFLRQEADKRI